MVSVLLRLASKTFLLTLLVGTGLIALIHPYIVLDAQTARYAVNGGTVSCSTEPSIFRLAAQTTGIGIAAGTGAGPCFVVGGVQVGGVSSAGLTTTDLAYGAAWNGQLEVPTRNSVYDAQFVSSPTSSQARVSYAVYSLDGANPTPWATGLTTVTSCTVTRSGSSSPGTSTSNFSVVIAGTTANVYGWMPTSGANGTMIDSTNVDAFYIICFGT